MYVYSLCDISYGGTMLRCSPLKFKRQKSHFFIHAHFSCIIKPASMSQSTGSDVLYMLWAFGFQINVMYYFTAALHRLIVCYACMDL